LTQARNLGASDMKGSLMRIAVTGMGAVSPLGCGVETVWSRLIESQSGIRRLAPDFAADVASQVAGLVPQADEPGGFDIDDVISPKDQKKMDRFIQFAIAAADEAIAQAGWTPDEAGRERTATVIATGIGGFPAIADAVRITDARGPRRLSPFTAPSFLPNLAAGWVSIRHGFKGPIGAPVTACAASVQAIGDAARLIHTGEADIAICGGAEASVNRVSMGVFAAARALSSGFNETPELASRPFDAGRDGFVMSEGAGVLVIESLPHAVARGAVPIAELVGYGTSADAYHLTAGPEDGSGAKRAMMAAIAQAGILPGQIGHLNAHATSTQVGDSSELAAIKAVFGPAPRLAISATKSATGHMLGAAGGIEAIFTVLALRDGIAPPTRNLDRPDPLADGLDIVGKTARSISTDYALSNGFGFGGVNASLIFRRWVSDTTDRKVA
jgi:3-oxoacyl-[acyl-carrier-protein] synthase II